MPPVSVCFVIDRLSRAGTETQLLALIRGLDPSRVRPSLCLLNGGDCETSSLLPDCPVLDLGLSRLRSSRTIVAALRLSTFWRRHRASVVQTYFIDSTDLAVPLARLCGIPRVYRVRNNVGYWMTPIHRRRSRLIGRWCRTLTNSDDARRELMRWEPASRAIVIENGVDAGAFAASPLPDLSRGTANVGIVANLRPVKNVSSLIRAAGMLPESIRFHVAGEGPQRTELQSAIDSAGMSDRLRLRGAVADVPSFLASVDIAVNCSLSESMSNAVLECMAAGKAIVVTNVGANARLIRDGVDGLVVPPDDDAALAAALRRLLGQPEHARSMAVSARRRAVEMFSRDAMLRRFERLYTEGM